MNVLTTGGSILTERRDQMKFIDSLKGLLRRISGSAAEIEALKQATFELGRACSVLETEKRLLSKQCSELKEEKQELRDEVYRLRSQRNKTSDENEALQKRVETLEQLNEELKHELQELAGIPTDELEQIQEEARAAIEHNDLVAYGGIDELLLDTRSWNCLKRSGIDTVAQLLGYTVLELLGKVDGLGRASLNGLAVKLAEKGLQFKEEKTAMDRAKAYKILEPSRMQLLKVEDLGLSKVSYSAAVNAGFKTAFDISRYSKGRLTIELGGHEYANEVAEKMSEFGFDLTQN